MESEYEFCPAVGAHWVVAPVVGRLSVGPDPLGGVLGQPADALALDVLCDGALPVGGGLLLSDGPDVRIVDEVLDAGC